MRRRHRLVAALGVALAGLGVLLLPVTGGAPASRAQAADTSQFQAGNIITDQLFFDGSAMSAAAVQTFLDVRNPNCVAGAMPCLKNYRQTTSTRAGSSSCPGTYAGATSETAATIITKVGQACGISQRVLLVVLQKEEGLVTATGSSLTATRYRSAMGFGCPDTAACDSTYYGFFNQVYAAASQYRRYASNPTYYSHRAGMTNNVRYNPDSSCGSSPVYIANQATAGLYNYTPYQPDAAALAAGAGSGDYCSAYGNRNFWIYFTNWFGSTQTAGAGDLADLYVSSGAENGPLGAVTEGVTCGLLNGGCKQGYANGSIYWSPATGAHFLQGAIAALYASAQGEKSFLGYPTQSVAPTSDGLGQFAKFQGGSIYWSPTTGAHSLSGDVLSLYASAGAEKSFLGYPTQSLYATSDTVGRFAKFQGGSIYWSPTTGARSLSGDVLSLYASAGAEKSFLGYPTQSVWPTSDTVGRFAKFQGGNIYWSPTTGARSLGGDILSRYAAAGAEKGPLGYPTQSVWALPDGVGRFATFQTGSIYWSPPTGAQALTGPIGDLWTAQGAERGPLGYPTLGTTTAADGASQYANFQGGSVYRSAGGTETLTGGIRDVWVAGGFDRGPLGAPTSSTTPTADGAGQFATFAGGSVYWSASTGARTMSGPIGAQYVSAGAEQSALGYPTSDALTAPDGKGQYAQFQGGTLYWSPTTGVRTMTGSIGALYASAGAERSWLGYPTTDVLTAADGTGQYAHFQGGSIYSSPSTGLHSLSGGILSLYASAGAEQSFLGYPTQSVWGTSDTVGRFAKFQGGSVYWSPTTGAHSMNGAILSLYASAGAEKSFLGYPTQSVWPASDTVGRFEKFQGGSVYWSPTTGAHSLTGQILSLYASAGAERSVLGYPTQSVWPTADTVGRFAKFQGGVAYWSPGTGAHVVRGAFLTAWAATGYEHGYLGYPTKDAYAVSGGSRVDFQHGSITVATSTGKATVVRR